MSSPSTRTRNEKKNWMRRKRLTHTHEKFHKSMNDSVWWNSFAEKWFIHSTRSQRQKMHVTGCRCSLCAPAHQRHWDYPNPKINSSGSCRCRSVGNLFMEFVCHFLAESLNGYGYFCMCWIGNGLKHNLIAQCYLFAWILWFLFASATKWFYLLFCGWIKDIIEMAQHCSSLSIHGLNAMLALDWCNDHKKCIQKPRIAKQEWKRKSTWEKLFKVQHEVDGCRAYYHNLEGNERPNEKKCTRETKSIK